MRPLERACFYANVCTITGPATAVADPMSTDGARFTAKRSVDFALVGLSVGCSIHQQHTKKKDQIEHRKHE
jgi:hypothetical protein